MLPFCCVYRHRQTGARAQRYHHLGFDRVTGDDAQPVVLGDGREEQLCFHHSKVVAYADPWPSSKGEVGIGRTCGRAFWPKTIRVEPLRLLPQGGMAMDCVRAHHDQTVGCNVVSSQFIMADGFATKDGGGWVQTQRLLNDHADVL